MARKAFRKTVRDQITGSFPNIWRFLLDLFRISGDFEKSVSKIRPRLPGVMGTAFPRVPAKEWKSLSLRQVAIGFFPALHGVKDRLQAFSELGKRIFRPGRYLRAYLAKRYRAFLHRVQGKHVLFLELAQGQIPPPGIIKYPFWQMTAESPRAVYACINLGEMVCPEEIKKQSLYIDRDIAEVLDVIRQ